MKLRDTFWLWGHPEGCFNNNKENFGNFLESRMTPAECCHYMGINKTFMVPMNILVTPIYMSVPTEMVIELLPNAPKLFFNHFS